MRDWTNVKQEQMQDEEFRQFYDEQQALADLSKAIVGARLECGWTQQELAKRSGISQGDISRLESCDANPSLRTLNRLAKCFGMKLQISFER